MELLKQYFDLQKQIYDYFDYKEDWVVIPIENATEYYWFLIERSPGVVVFSEKPFSIEGIRSGNIFSNSIYTQRFLPKWVYRKEEYTMVSVDTNTDGNKFLQIFDNSKECKDQEMIKVYQNCW